MWGMEQISADLALKNKNMLLEVERPAGRPYILLCRGLLRFARLGASALWAEASARGAMTTPCPAHRPKNKIAFLHFPIDE